MAEILALYKYEPIDLCACYEPIFIPPKELLAEWKQRYEALPIEPTLENTSFYVTMPDRTKYFYCCNTRIKVSEHFSDSGNTMGDLIADVIQFAARQGCTAQSPPICA